MRDELGLSLVESGLIVTTFNVLGMLVGVLAGMAGDRFGRKPMALAGLGLMAAGVGVILVLLLRPLKKAMRLWPRLSRCRVV